MVQIPIFMNRRRTLGRRGEVSSVLTIISLLMIVGCRGGRAAAAMDTTRGQIWVFQTDADFNVTSKRGFLAPKCSRFCYPFPPELFVNKTSPCSQWEDKKDIDKWIPCLCTHRPFMRYLVDCIFRKCGPAIPSAFEFGYQICSDYNIKFPSPPNAVKILNVTILNDAIDIPDTIPKLPYNFTTDLPPPQYEASISDENPPLNLELSKSTGWRGRNLFGMNIWDDRSQPSIAPMIFLWSFTLIGLMGGFAELVC